MEEKLRRAKILVTMGPALENVSVLAQVLLAGADAFRINFSHGNAEQHARYVSLIRATAARMGRPCALLADLMGPKVRVDAREYELRNGHEVTVVPRPGHPERDEIGISFSGLAALVGPRQRILLDDGKLELVVESVRGKRIVCRVVRGGTLKPNKSLNVPGVDIGLPILGAKDKADLRFIRRAGFDWVAASFVRHAADVKSVKRYMASLGLHAPVIAKVESAQAIDNLREIITEAEGVMVARGDLGVELDLEMIPTIQRNIVRLGRELGKVTIIATQMLESMTTSSRPTRAEVNDVSTGALERVDALMLSGETSVGKYPVETVRMMDRTIRTTERNLEEEIVGISHPEPIALTCEAGIYLSLISGAKALITLSTYGSTPRILSTYRGNIPVAVACMRPDVYHRSSLYYSVLPLMIKPARDPEKVFRGVEIRLKKMGLVKSGDVVVFVFGYPIHAKNHTNTIRRWEIA
jgi:pyruvate kinase